MLPADLRTAETELLEAVRAALAKGGRGLWTAELRFEGLRILPVALRLLANLQPQVAGIRLLCADAGATALAKRDAPDLADSISSLGDLQRLQQADGGSDGVVILERNGPLNPSAQEALDQLLRQGKGALLLPPTHARPIGPAG